MSHSQVNSELTLFSYEVLGLVGRGGAGAHDLLRMARRMRLLDWAGESQYYVEPKRLARVGYDVTRASLGTLRDDVADLRRRIEESAQAAEAFPHCRKQLLIANRFLQRLVDLHLELVAEVERE